MKEKVYKICEQCSTSFIPGAGTKGRFCCHQCANKFNETYSRNKVKAQLKLQEKEYSLNQKYCISCNTALSFSQRNNKFCNVSCAAKFNNQKRKDNGWKLSEESRKKLSNTAKNSEAVLAANKSRTFSRIDKTCPVCHNTFSVIETSSFRIYCSKNCYKNDIGGKFRKKTPGGYRNGSGRSKPGYYKGIYCGSTYELCWVIYRLDHNLPVQRFTGYIIYGDNKKYYPDFIDGNHIYEMKGWKCATTDAVLKLKNQAAIDSGYSIDVLFKEDLKYVFDYVKGKYHTSNFPTLYDGYRPKFDYICNHCNKSFSKDKILTTTSVFCSRECAGKERAKIKHTPFV